MAPVLVPAAGSPTGTLEGVGGGAPAAMYHVIDGREGSGKGEGGG